MRALVLSLAGAAPCWASGESCLPGGLRHIFPEIALVMVAGAAASLLRGRPSLHRQPPLVAATVACLTWLALRTLLPHGANWEIILSYATVIGFYAAAPSPAMAALGLWAGRI